MLLTGHSEPKSDSYVVNLLEDLRLIDLFHLR